MKLYKNLEFPKRFWLEIGWFSGQEFILFGITFLSFWDTGGTFFELQIAKFSIGFGWKD